jgi:PIN domain nuclease of toxin-antitoxin system
VIVLADTHALIWWLTAAPQLSDAARQHLRRAEDDQTGGILVSVASRIDLHYLAKKPGFSDSFVTAVWGVVQEPDRNIRAIPITPRIADRFGTPEFDDMLKDPYDRLIAATAIDLDLPLVSKDRMMHSLAGKLPLRVLW